MLVYAAWLCGGMVVMVPLVRRGLAHLRGQSARRLFALMNLPGLLLLVYGFLATILLVGHVPPSVFEKRAQVWNRTHKGVLVAIAWYYPRSETVHLGPTSVAGRAIVFTWVGPGARLAVRYGDYASDSQKELCVLGFSRRAWWPTRSNLSLEWATKSPVPVGDFDVEVRSQAPAKASVGPVSAGEPFHIRAIVGPGSLWAPAERIWPAIRTDAAWAALWASTAAILSMGYLVFWAVLGLAGQTRRTLPRDASKSVGMAIVLVLSGLAAYQLIGGVLLPITKALFIFGLRL